MNIRKKNLDSLSSHCPQFIDNNFICDNNLLITLEGGPSSVSGYYYCDQNKLISLKGAPKKVGDYFSCSNNNLKTLKYAPEIVGGSFLCTYNNISSFKNVFEYIHKINGSFVCSNNPVKKGLLHILLIKGIKEIISSFEEIDDIINKYLITNKSGTPKAMFDVQKLIIEAKLKGIRKSVYME